MEFLFAILGVLLACAMAFLADRSCGSNGSIIEWVVVEMAVLCAVVQLVSNFLPPHFDPLNYFVMCYLTVRASAGFVLYNRNPRPSSD
jgi:hypothetical protein